MSDIEASHRQERVHISVCNPYHGEANRIVSNFEQSGTLASRYESMSRPFPALTMTVGTGSSNRHFFATSKYNYKTNRH